MEVTSTMNWKITDVITAATNAAETMASSGIAGDVSADITKLRMDVRKQAIASLAGFIGGVNYSETFHMSADNQRKNAMSPAVPPLASVDGIDQAEAKVDYSVPSATAIDNPMFDAKKMYSAVEHANAVTRTYGVEVLSINIISASPYRREFDSRPCQWRCGALRHSKPRQPHVAMLVQRQSSPRTTRRALRSMHQGRLVLFCSF